MNHFYVYLHLTADTKEPFYIGKGKGRRAYESRSRNNFWKNTVNKHGFTVDFLGINLSEQEALELEIKSIEKYKTRCNLTKGGQGTAGYVFDPELVRKRNQRNKDLHANKEWVDRRNNAIKLAMKRPEVREKLVKFQKIKKHEIKQGLRRKHPGTIFTAEAIRRISEAQKGEKGFWYGKTTAVARPVSNLSNGDVFVSLKAAAESVNGNYRSLLRAIKARKLYKGQMFEYKDRK